MSPELQGKESSVSAAWLGYGMEKALWKTKLFLEKNPSASTYVYSLAEEVECRKSLAKIWLEMKGKNGKTDQYLDDLATVVDAGFITEYVWHYLRQPDWIAPDTLREVRFQSWARENIAKHKCITLANVSSDEDKNEMTSNMQKQKMLNKALSDVSNRRYKNAESLLGQLFGSMPANWKAFSEIGDSIYCAFWDTTEESNCVKEHPNRTIIPMFPSYSRAFYLLGFIAMEKEDAEGALSQLSKASSLQPDHPIILLEKATVLSKLRRPKEAYECFVLAEKPHYASSPFVLARALRGQGMTLIDLGRLDEAEVCFENSLKYEPDSKLVMNEMEYVRRLRSKQAVPGAEIKINKVKEK
jgi:tetratricopeptide (TPR) repeat protein